MSASAADSAKKACTSLDADREISAVETLSTAKLKVDMPLNSAHTALHRTSSEPGSESEATAKASELKSLKEKRVYTGTTGAMSRRKHGTCCVAFEEEAKTEDIFTSTTLTTSIRVLLSFAIDRKSEGHTVFTADVKKGLPQRQREAKKRCVRQASA